LNSNDWKAKYNPISLTLKRGKEVIDIQVENLKKPEVKNYIEERMKRIEVKKGVMT